MTPCGQAMTVCSTSTNTTLHTKRTSEFHEAERGESRPERRAASVTDKDDHKIHQTTLSTCALSVAFNPSPSLGCMRVHLLYIVYDCHFAILHSCVGLCLFQAPTRFRQHQLVTAAAASSVFGSDFDAWHRYASLALALGTASVASYVFTAEEVDEATLFANVGTVKPELPEFTLADIASHKPSATKDGRLWVTFKSVVSLALIDAEPAVSLVTCVFA
jgi:hypothetical protein